VKGSPYYIVAVTCADRRAIMSSTIVLLALLSILAASSHPAAAGHLRQSRRSQHYRAFEVLA
jgi:hypothetical protein